MQEAVELDGGRPETYSDGADASTYTVNTIIQPVLSWGLYRANNGSPTSRATPQARALAPAISFASLVASSPTRAARSYQARHRLLLGDQRARGPRLSARRRQAYATIDRSSSTNAVSREGDRSGIVHGGITKALIRQDIAQIYDAGGRYPRSRCATDVYLKIASLFDANIAARSARMPRAASS